jgi:hypothetical protein
MYQVRPEIYRWGNICKECGRFYRSGDNRIKFMFKGKELILTEKIKRDITDSAVLEYKGKTFPFKKVSEAELKINEILLKDL